MKDYFLIAIRTFTARKMRTFLTMIGIFIGIAAVVALISLGQGLQNAVTTQFEMMGVDKIMIMAKGSMLGIGDKVFSDDDVKVIRRVSGVKSAGGMIYKALRINTGDEIKYSFVTGIPQDETKDIIQSMSSMKIKYGRDLKNGDNYKVVAGIMNYEGEFFKKKLRLGDKIEIEDKKFEIIGFMDRIGNPQDDSQFLITMDSARTIMNEPTKLDIIIAQASEGVDVSALGNRINKDLRKSRDLKEGEEDFNVQTSQQLLESFSSVFSIISAVLIGIAVISLFVGGIGIMNTMYTSVLERTREIGIMKAVGARNSDVFWIFVIESGILGLGGGIIGVLMGFGISKIVELGIHAAGITFITAYFSWYLVFGALAFSLVVGIASGVFPAVQASKLVTVDALRYE